MKHSLTHVAVGVLAITAVAVSLAGCSGGQGGGGSAAGKSLVVDNSFDLKTADPNREYELTGGIVAKALYQQLLTFNGSDVTKPVPDLATYTMNADNTVMTLTMRPGAKFSDGTPVTVDDAVFSLQRVQGIKGNPSFLLDGITIAKTGSDTLTLTSQKPDPALPFLLPSPSLSVVNSKVVKAHGGSTTASDSAEAFLDQQSAGSGPYELSSFDAQKQVVFTANPHYSGPKPAYSRVVLRNVQGPTQQLDVQKGDAQVALDLNPDQVAGLTGSKVKIQSSASPDVIFLLLNQNPAVNKFTSNPDFLKAVKLGIDYDKIVSLAGKGSVRPGGIIPSLFVGGMDASQGNQQDVSAAKAALAKSGYDGSSVTLNFPNDITVEGLNLQSVAESVQAQLASIGIKVTLAPAPVATELDAYRGGKETIGLWYWGPDYPDPSDYLAFTPGQLVGLRAGWPANADPAVTALVDTAAAATGDARKGAYEAMEKQLNATGPFIPLLQPAQNVVTASSISSVTTNAVWVVDLATIK